MVECSTEHVIDVGLCIECNNCEMACAARHGHARLQRQNFYQRSIAEIIPRTCKQCFGRDCVKVCQFDALRIDEVSGTVVVGENCVGCGLCAEACPYGSINMIELSVPRRLEERADKKSFFGSWLQREQTELKTCANKCDLCIGYQDMACINQCPTGALRLRMIYRRGEVKEPENPIVAEEKELIKAGNTQRPCLIQDLCVKCGLCVKKCPVNAITMNPYPVIDEVCIGCGACVKCCGKQALIMTESSGNCLTDISDSCLPCGDNWVSSLKGEIPVTFKIEIKLDAQMTQDNLRNLLAVLKSELYLTAEKKEH